MQSARFPQRSRAIPISINEMNAAADKNASQIKEFRQLNR